MSFGPDSTPHEDLFNLAESCFAPGGEKEGVVVSATDADYWVIPGTENRILAADAHMLSLKARAAAASAALTDTQQ